MSERVAVIIVTYQKTEFQKDLLEASINSVTTHMKRANIIVLDDNHSSENLPDIVPGICLEKTKYPQCGEVNAYIWACDHRTEYDTFVFLHDSAIVLKEIPTSTPDHFRPLWFASKCIRDNLKGNGVEEIMKEFTVKGESCDTIYQALLQNRGSIVFGGMAIFDSVFVNFLAEETNVLELAPRLNTRFLRCFFERMLFMVYSKFGDSNRFNKSALCGDIFNHRDAFVRSKTIRPELAGNPYVLKVWQGR